MSIEEIKKRGIETALVNTIIGRMEAVTRRIKDLNDRSGPNRAEELRMIRQGFADAALILDELEKL